MSQWVEIAATLSAKPEDWSVYADVFEQFGCPSSMVDDRNLSISGALANVAGVEEQIAKLAAALEELGVKSVRHQPLDDQDWSQIWKDHFKPMRIGNRFVIRPTWEPADAHEELIEIVLDPGQAFGTGDHATTRMCLELVEIWSQLGMPSESPILDIGAGSGILSIGASKLGYSHVVGTDIDPIAVEVAKENAARNSADCTFITVNGLQDPRLRGPWTLIISNIISATLIRLAPGVAQVCDTNAHWIVSGIIVDNWPDVLKAAELSGFTLIEKREDSGWVGALLKKL